MELHLPFTPPTAPSTHVTHSGTPVTRWVWDSTKRPAYADSLQSPACDQLLQHSIQASSTHQLNQAGNLFTSARTTAYRLAGFRQKKRASSNSNSTQHQRPVYWDEACRALHCQWRRAERRNPGAPSTIALLAQLQAMLTARKRSFGNKDIFTFANLCKTDPCKFFQQTRAPQSSPPTELTSPSAWDPLISKLTSPPAQSATNMPPPHQPQPPPANALLHPSQLKKSASAYSGFTMAEQAPCKAIHLSSSDMPELFPHQSPQPRPTSSSHAYRPCSLKLTAQARYPSNGRLLSSTPSSKHADASDPANHRPIAVGEPLCRLYASILNHRLTQYTEQLCTHTHQLDTNLTSAVSTKHLFYNTSLISKHMHTNHCTSVL